MTTIELDQEGRVKNAPVDLIREVVEHVTKYRDAGLASRDGKPIDSEKVLRNALKRAENDLAMYLLMLPREDGEDIRHYVQRLETSSIPQLQGAHNALNRAARAAQGLRRLDELRLEQLREEERLRARERQRIRDQEKMWRKALTPDKAKVRELQRIIRDAEEGEEFLAKLYETLAAHRRARDAREELERMHQNAVRAAQMFGKEPPLPFKYRKADQRTVDMCELLSR